MMSVVLGDEFFVAGFLYGGFDKGIVAQDEKEAITKIEELMRNGNIGVIVVAKHLFGDESDYLNNIKSDALKPFIVEVESSFQRS